MYPCTGATRYQGRTPPYMAGATAGLCLGPIGAVGAIGAIGAIGAGS